MHGRVLDPDGKPIAGAEIFVRPHARSGRSSLDPPPKGQRGRVAASDADGRFRFDLDKASSDFPWGDEPAWHRAQIAAAAPGLAPAWVEAGSLLKGDEAVLRLARDDVPIRGRVVDPQGRPIAGVTVRLRQIAAVKDGADLDAMLASGEMGDEPSASWYGAYYDTILPGRQDTWTTDADGRFEVRGVGRDRIASLVFRAPTLAESSLHAIARPSRTPPRPRPKPARTNRDLLFMGRPPAPLLVGATFEHVVGPTKPIVGIVREKGTGRPLEGIRVSGMEGATWTSAAARTDAQGRFRLIGLPKGEVYQVTANQEYTAVAPFLRAQATVNDTEGLKPIELTLDLPRGVASPAA